MAKIHNKKRNIGIIYEQIVQYICKKAMENNEADSETGMRIIKECFRKGTQLNKEYRLFKALADTKGISGPLANSIIFEAKKACNNMFDSEKLEKEKSGLIRKLNYSFGKGKIFEESVAVLRFGGGCQGCGMVDVTLKEGVEKTLLGQIPQLTEVRDVTDHSVKENAYYQ